jgi:O-acetyl-ADP-ribose deacetylase (regulator of RNase III)
VIRVVIGDLALMPADAVVRTADADLLALGPRAARLDAAGGDRFTAQRRTATVLEAGAAVVTGAGALAAPFVLHVVLADARGPASQANVRRALVGAWQRAADWGLRRIAAPPVGADPGPLSLEEAVTLLVETFPHAPDPQGPAELEIVVEAEAERDVVEAIVRRLM